ncbi:MAG: gamma-glutamyltransferase [Pirellulaceae bacterium]
MGTRRPSRREFLTDASLLLAGGACALSHEALGQDLQAAPVANVAQGQRGVVASVHPLASQAAIAAFERGGNAIDAAVAASLMLSVVDGHNSGIGGGCLALIRKSDGRVLALDGREKAPAAATPNMFYRDGQPDPNLSQIGPLAAGVPGLLAALERLSREHGDIAWNNALENAAAVADDGFEISDNYAGVLASVAQNLSKFPATAQVLLDEVGKPWPAGHRLRQADLAATLRQISQHGAKWFYQGPFANACSDFLKQSGGLITPADFANYNTVERRPVKTPYRENSVIGFPPPSSGGIHIAQMLGMLSAYDVKSIFAESTAAGLHLLLEVMKRAMADRAYWLGDADFAKVPLGLLDPAYLRQRAGSIELTRATPVESHGQPPRADVDLFGQQKHTTHLTTADESGNVVAITQTVNTSFGCKMIVPGTGVVLNNEMDDFSIAPGVRNAFGLVGSDANLVAPGKRPLSSMSPTLVLNEAGEPILSCGAAGGPKIITTVLQVLVRVLDLGESVEQALAAPRVHHQWSPDRAVCEEAWPNEVLAELSSLGHEIQRISHAAVAQALAREPNSGKLNAASDPRVPSAAMGIS